MKAKRLIEVAMPIKEISAESTRDKRVNHGHISTVHLWWARRPLPACRAVVFGSLVPDPLDENCPKAFIEAIDELLMKNIAYKPYRDIPYTASLDQMEDNRRNRLLMFIGKFTDRCQSDMIAGKSTPPADQISIASLIKWEAKNDPQVIGLAQKLIWIAYNSELDNAKSYKEHTQDYSHYRGAIVKAEENLYSIKDRHLDTAKVKQAEVELNAAIDAFTARMPAVFDPFSGGGAIPLEAARLGCRSYGNDINPVAHIIEKGSAEYPQRFGKPIVYSADEFNKRYGKEGISILERRGETLFNHDIIRIPNRLSFDLEYYAKRILKMTKDDVGHLYPKDSLGNTAVAYYWARTAICSNPSCRAEVPLLRQFYLSSSSKKPIYLKPIIKGNSIDFEIKTGKYDSRQLDGFSHRGTITCPCCGNITDIDEVKRQSNNGGLRSKLLAIISESDSGKTYSIPSNEAREILTQKINVEYRPDQAMVRNSNGGDTHPWGFTKWGDLFSERQLNTINHFVKNLNIVKSELPDTEYNKALITYLAIWIDRLLPYNTTFGIYETGAEKVQRIFGRQAISMVFDYPESNPFCDSSGSALNMLDWLLRFFDTECSNPFYAKFTNASSGDKLQFEKKSLTSVVTDPPYYDAIAYADCSDFFYVWLKRTVGDLYPLTFSTPQTPKTEECTALKYHHNGDEEKAKHHFENKLTEIFDAIELQTTDIVSIMFAHQSTEAWTTLCNSILGARMNITGSWPLDTEMTGAMKSDKGYLESSVTVACRPSERKGFADFKEVKKAIFEKVEEEVNSLYELGFRGADLLTACFGQAVSEFGKYKIVEKANGSEVSVAELLDIARTSAFNALLKGVQGDEYTRFYIGWLQMNGMGETDFDDATKFTRVGMQVDISDIFAQRLLIRNGSKQHLATAAEHIGNSSNQGTHQEDPLIDQVHRAMLAYEKGDRHILLTLLHNVGADDQNASFWRLVASLKELLPEGKDLKAIEGLMGNSDNLRQESREVDQHKPEQMTFDFGSDFNNDFK